MKARPPFCGRALRRMGLWDLAPRTEVGAMLLFSPQIVVPIAMADVGATTLRPPVRSAAETGDEVREAGKDRIGPAVAVGIDAHDGGDLLAARPFRRPGSRGIAVEADVLPEHDRRGVRLADGGEEDLGVDREV